MLDGAVVDAIQRNSPTPEAVDIFVEEAARLEESRQKERPNHWKRRERGIRDLRTELDRFMYLIASVNARDCELVENDGREERMRELESEPAAYQTRPASETDRRRLYKASRARAGRFDDSIHSYVARHDKP